MKAVTTDFSSPPIVVWQGFHHQWTYNHRLNRVGDWIEHLDRAGNSVHALANHSAASGSGEDDAQWECFHTVVQARDVWFHPVRVETIRLEGREEQDQEFAKEVRIPLPREMQGRQVYTVLLNGFDLCSESDADKLASFHLAVSAPVWESSSRELVFHIFGGLNVDCDSAECDGYPTLGQFIASMIGSTAVGAHPVVGALIPLVGSLFKKLKLKTSYTLDVQALVVAGDAEHLNVESATYSRSFDWDKETAIRRSDQGVLSVTVRGDSGSHWQASTLGLRQISLDVTRERGLFKPDTAMHYLQWDCGIIPVSSTATEYTADLHLFFRNWRNKETPFLNDLEQSILTHRDAGAATVTAGVCLLQFSNVVADEADSSYGTIEWRGKNKSAKGRDAVQRSKLDFESVDAPVSQQRLRSVGNIPCVLHTVLS